MRYLSLLIALVSACTPHHRPSTPDSTSLSERLKEKRDGWLVDMTKLQDKTTGWFSPTNCDGTLWMGEAVAAGYPGRLGLAEWAPGEVHRHPRRGPLDPDDCTISTSRDMLLGYILGMAALKDVEALHRLLSYGEVNRWVMGTPIADGRVVMSPALRGLLARVIDKLGGVSGDYGKEPEPCLPVADEYEYHLQALTIYLDGKTNGGISDVCLVAIENDGESHPSDALIQAVRGVYSGKLNDVALQLLSDDYACPSYVQPVLPAYCLVHKAMAAKIVIDSFDGVK